MPKAPTTNSDLQRQLAELKVQTSDVREAVRGMNDKMTAFIARTEERGVSNDRRLCNLENHADDRDKWLIGALFSALLAMLGVAASWIFKK